MHLTYFSLPFPPFPLPKGGRVHGAAALPAPRLGRDKFLSRYTLSRYTLSRDKLSHYTLSRYTRLRRDTLSRYKLSLVTLT